MSIIKLVTKIHETSLALQTARDNDDIEVIEHLEDELYELELQLEDEEQRQHDDHHLKHIIKS